MSKKSCTFARKIYMQQIADIVQSFEPIILKPADETGVYKIIENNHVIIIRNNEKYDVTGKKL